MFLYGIIVSVYQSELNSTCTEMQMLSVQLLICFHFILCMYLISKKGNEYRFQPLLNDILN